MVQYMAGDDGARTLIDKLLAGEVSLALTAFTALHLWSHYVSDRKTEMHMSALIRFIEQIPLTGDVAKIAGSIHARNRPDVPDEHGEIRLAELKAVNATTALETGMPIYSRDVDWYEGLGCQVLSY
ncbi:MAG: hypothetical protein BZY67_04285 [SAR202 cluster bacterium Io17-Chloro-G1]|nr:MAG: hypothetical protein BZY67_04285 [SAR202 cluster bacterium Io17-Chloro-G1]